MITATCPDCGALVDGAARFCPNCGSSARRPEPSGPSLQVGPERLTRTQEERRVVTVLFADLTGSTALGERLDPEDMRGVLERFFDALAREVLKLDGTVDKYVGDEIMAVFGAPVAHEDDAARALQAAIAMQRSMTSLNQSVDPRLAARLSLRIGINTGEVVAGVLAGQFQAAYTVIGDPVNTAKRLQSAARPGEIVVGERTRQATARLFEYEAARPVAAKGKGAPLATYRYLRPVTVIDETAAVPGRAFVGRVIERDALVGAVERVRAGTGGVVAIVGEPGMGKTRLLAEARAAARTSGVTWLQGHASSNGQTMSYLPFREMLRSFAGIEAADADDVKWLKLEKRVSDVLGAEAKEILPYLGAAVSLKLADESAERVVGLDGEAMRRQILRSAYLLFEGLARVAPTAIAFEDWHWVDRSSEQLLTHLLPLSSRLLFIWTGRPEPDSAVERTVQACGELPANSYTELSLVPLSPDDSTALLCEILETKSCPAGLRDAVVRRAEGNPFYAGEILRAFQDLSVLKRDASSGLWTLSDEHDPSELPTTVQGVIAARVDRLSEDAREVARVAAVIGRSFSYRMLVAIDSGLRDVAAGLAELEQQAIVRQRSGGERSYVFAHALVQEAVYAGVLVRRRKELHTRVARAMELLLGEQIHENYGVLAHHYAQAEDWPKAQEYLFKVGDQALRIAADAEAVDHYERALDAYARAFGDRWEPFERAAVERKIGESRYRLGEFERATTHLDRALELLDHPRPRTRRGVRVAIARELLRQVGHRVLPWLARRGGPSAAVNEAVLQTLWFHQFIDYSSDLERLLYDILRALNIAERGGPSHRTLRAYFGMTLMCHNIGLTAMGSRYAGMASRMGSSLGGTLANAFGHASVGLDHYALGRWEAAASDLTAAADGYLAAGELEAWAGVSGYLNIVLVGQGHLGRAAPIADILEETGQATRDRRIEALGPHCRAHVLSWAGREDEATAEYERAMKIYRSIPDHHLWLSAAGALAKLHLRMGAVNLARLLVDEGVQLAREHRLAGWWLTQLLTARAELLLHDAADDTSRDRTKLLSEAQDVCRQLRKQGRLHSEALPSAHRERGALEWQRGRPAKAADAWRRSLAAAQKLTAVTEQFETHETVARYTGSTTDREAARSIAERLRSSMSEVKSP